MKILNFVKQNYMLLSVIILGAILRLYHLDYQSLWMDEIYTMNVSNPELTFKEFHNECIRLVDDIYMYDSLRADRTIAGNGIEARVPYANKDYIEFYMSIDPDLRVPRSSKLLNITEKTEKALLREAFYETELLPKEVLTRIKSAFSKSYQ